MKRDTLIFISLGALAAAVTVYFFIQKDKTPYQEGYVSDADVEAFDLRENTGPAIPVE